MGSHHPLVGLLTRVLRDAHRWRRQLVVAVSLMVAVGMGAITLVSERYESGTSIYVEERNVLGPLMEGAAVQADVNDRARIVRELLYSRSLLQEVLVRIGELGPEPGLLASDEAINRLRDSLTVITPGKNFIRIRFLDPAPDRARDVANAMADAFIEASHAQRIYESRRAYEFIGTQVDEYQQKVDRAEASLEAFQQTERAARPGMEVEVGRRIADLRSQEEDIAQSLREARIALSSLEGQLQRQKVIGVSEQKARERSRQLDGLDLQLSTLRTRYTETHPDVRAIREKIESLQSDRTQTGWPDDPVIGSGGETVYANVKAAYLSGQTEVATLESRLESTRTKLREEIGLGESIAVANQKLIELERDVEVNMGLLTDLLRRREVAKISFSLATERQGLHMRIDERAYLPTQTSGIRRTHLFVALPLLALGLAFGALGALQFFPFGIRHREDMFALGEIMNVPVFSVPSTLGGTA